MQVRKFQEHQEARQLHKSQMVKAYIIKAQYYYYVLKEF